MTEVGQLSHETWKGGEQSWAIRTIHPERDGTPTDASTIDNPDGQPMTLQGSGDMSWMVNRWMDTIVIPAHGYVRMRYWMNVPQQTGGEGAPPEAITVQDNANREGAWVYHCHILRHEDRGMMMIVKTQESSGK